MAAQEKPHLRLLPTFDFSRLTHRILQTPAAYGAGLYERDRIIDRACDTRQAQQDMSRLSELRMQRYREEIRAHIVYEDRMNGVADEQETPPPIA